MDWGSLFLSFILTIIAYLAFPIIKLLMNQSKFEKKRAKRIALWNSIVVGAIFCIITIATSDAGNTWNAAPAVLYYFINCAILTDKNAQPEVAKNNNIKSESTEQYTVHPPQISDVDEVPKTHGNYNILGSDIMLQKDESRFDSLFSDDNKNLNNGAKSNQPSQRAHAEELLRSLMDDTNDTRISSNPKASETKYKYICLSDSNNLPERKSGGIYSEDIILQNPDSKIKSSHIASSTKTNDPETALKAREYISAIKTHEDWIDPTEDFKDIIFSLIYENDIHRKTDILLYGLDNLNELLETIKGTPDYRTGSTNLNAIVHFRIYLDCVLALDSDGDTVNELYITYKLTGAMNDSVHKYINLMIKISDLLDRIIVYLFENLDKVSLDHYPIAERKIRKYLNEYVDDNTDWNKI